MSKKITIKIDKKGKVNVEFDGYQGEACMLEAERLDNMVASFGVSTKNKKVEMKEQITDDPLQLNKEYN